MTPAIGDRPLAPSTPSGVHRASRIEGRRLKFAAAHMATYGGTIEPMHGHNYQVTIEASGRLAADGWVIDFGALKKIGREICETLDHHFLLQASSELVQWQRGNGSIELSFQEKRYLFPEADVLELPIANTTTELIAEWFWTRVAEGLIDAGIDTIEHLAIGVEEAPGQAGWYSAPSPAPAPA